MSVKNLPAMLALPMAATVCGTFLFATLPTSAQDAPKPLEKATAPIKESAAADAVEPQSIDALKAMGAYLAGLKNFGLKSDYETQMALDNDQVIDIGGTTSYDVRRPDGLRATVEGDLGSREFIYNGKQLTVVDPDEKAYGRAEVAPTIKGMLEQVGYHLGIELPLSDLFNFGTDDAPEKNITEGFLVSDAKVDGVPAKHWAYRTAGKDFEVWIKEGDEPIPLRFVILDDTIPARPRFEANLQWTPDAEIPVSTFEFTPPTDFEEIGFVMQSDEAGETTK